MRVFIISGIFHPESGGPATYLYYLLPELLACGYQVRALTFGDAPTDAYPYPLERISRRSYLRSRWQHFRRAAQMWTGHDVAYIHAPGTILPPKIRPRVGKIVGDVAWERATRKGWVPPTVDIDTFQRTRYSLPVQINKMLRARRARTFDHIIVPSEHRRQMVLRWGVAPERVTVIYNALPPTFAPPEHTQQEARRLLALPDAPLLFTAARLTPLKGIGESIRAVARIPDVHLVIAGDGHIRPHLEALAAKLNVKERVHFLGHIPHAKIPLYYRAADYTLLFSGGEGLSHVLLESLHIGTPAIASDSGGNPEVVEHDVNGLLVPTGDTDALTDTIQHAIHPATKQRLAAGTSHGLERFAWGRMVSQTINVLEQFA